MHFYLTDDGSHAIGDKDVAVIRFVTEPESSLVVGRQSEEVLARSQLANVESRERGTATQLWNFRS